MRPGLDARWADIVSPSATSRAFFQSFDGLRAPRRPCLCPRFASLPEWSGYAGASAG